MNDPDVIKIQTCGNVQHLTPVAQESGLSKDVGVRLFMSGATRSPELEKFDYEGFLSPLALERYAAYMHKHRKQADGALRASDNWQKGIPKASYMQSMWRHFIDVWKQHRGLPTNQPQEENLCALLFNVMGLLHEQCRGDDHATESDALDRR
jgi:hypothetical protein